MGSTREPRQHRSKATKRKIMDAGKLLFATQGYDNIHAGTIVEAAGTSVGSFYAYFDDKHDLLMALANEYYETTKAKELSVLEGFLATETVSNIDSMIRDFLTHSLGNHREDAAFLRELLRLAPYKREISAILDSIDHEIRLALTKVFVERFTVPEKIALATAPVVYAAAEGVIHCLAFEPEKLDEQTAIESLTTMIGRLVQSLT